MERLEPKTRGISPELESVNEARADRGERRKVRAVAPKTRRKLPHEEEGREQQDAAGPPLWETAHAYLTTVVAVRYRSWLTSTLRLPSDMPCVRISATILSTAGGDTVFSHSGVAMLRTWSGDIRV